ncbi:restriction endonuclease subunit S [Flavobacteriaceae bacterium]|nr:restriction endonuclease subunit S [Flavobacteriaceae bacterium]
MMQEVLLSSICDLKNGFAFKSKDYVDSSNTLSCRMSSIRPGGNFDLEHNQRFLPDTYAEVYSDYLLNDGDIVIAMTDLAGDPKILGVPTIVNTGGKKLLQNQRVGKLVITDSSKVFIPYLQYALNRPSNKSYYKKFADGGLQINVSKKDILNNSVPLPPLDQQKKIAAILDAADTYRQKTKALIAKYDELLNSIVYQCLGDSLNKDLKNIKSGSNEFLEDGYSWYSLNEITEVIADIDHKMPKSVEKGKIFLSAKDLSDNGELDFSNPKFISEEDFKHLSRKVKPKKLDVIYSRIGAKLGKARLVKTDHDFIVSYSCCTIRPKQDIVAPLYLKYILDSEATLRQASHGTRGIGVPDLGMGEIRTFKIPVPEKSISKKIVNQLEIIETQKAQAQDSLVQSEDLFNSLLQRAFKGELI